MFVNKLSLSHSSFLCEIYFCVCIRHTHTLTHTHTHNHTNHTTNTPPHPTPQPTHPHTPPHTTTTTHHTSAPHTPTPPPLPLPLVYSPPCLRSHGPDQPCIAVSLTSTSSTNTPAEPSALAASYA